MIFNDKTIEAIDKEYYKNVWEENGYHNGVMGLEISKVTMDRISSNGMVICNVEELSAVIEELTMFREAIERVTGITF